MNDPQCEYHWLASANRDRALEIDRARRAVALVRPLCIEDELVIEQVRNSLVNVRDALVECEQTLTTFFPLHLGTIDRIRMIHDTLGYTPSLRTTPRIREINPIVPKLAIDQCTRVLSLVRVTTESAVPDGRLMMSIHRTGLGQIECVQNYLPNLSLNYVNNVRSLAELEQYVKNKRHRKTSK